MANDVTFIKKQGGLGRPLAGEDFISGLLYYTDTLPSGFLSTDRIKKIFSVTEAEALGITNTSLGATAATSTYVVSNKGAVGDTVKYQVTGVDGVLTTLANYTQVTADVASTTTAALRLATEINLTTAIHGYSASPSTATVTVTAPKKQGVFLNTGTNYVVTIVGTFAGTLTQSVVAGVPSEIDPLHYHISEFFRMQPKGQLYVGVYGVSDATTFASVTLMVNYSLGKLRQLGIFQKTTTFAGTQVTALQAIITSNTSVHKPLEIVYQGEMSASTLATLADMRALAAPNVSVVFGQDGANIGKQLWLANAKSIGCLGTTLGAIAFAKVSDSICWIGKFNVSNTEFDTLAFANGVLYSAQTDGLINSVDSLGYIFPKKHIGIEGSYFNDSHTATPITGDFAYIENNRTFNKAIRGLRTFILPALGSPLDFNADGTLTEATIGYFETLADSALAVMQRDAELSAYSVTIDPSQPALSTSTLVVSVSIVPKGVARNIVVNVGFTLSI
jgi:hypothetical protein